jgi:molybdopterin converting factor small subunit
MKITLEFVGVLLGDALEQKRDIEVDDDISMREFLQNAMKTHRGLVDIVPGDPPRPTSNVIILVNGREIGVLAGLETKLQAGDEVIIIPVSHGG